MARSLRTFVELAPSEMKFMRVLQRLVMQRRGRKTAVPLHLILRGMILDYRKVLLLASTPEFLEAFEEACKPLKRKGRKRRVAPTAGIEPAPPV